MQNRYFIILLSVLALFNFNDLKAQQKDVYNFSADRLTYSQDNNIIEATGNVVAKNQE
jgi:lipopolysaccharide assembly outer membrane protein LptD (OstA)